jgi:prepilin-type N-terminal cleavage/methylation domain-containing protein
MHHAKNGFTLIELVVAALIIGLLSVVLIPNALGSRAAANNSAVQSFLKSLAQEQEVLYRAEGYYYPPGDEVGGIRVGTEAFYGRQAFVTDLLESAAGAAANFGAASDFNALSEFSIVMPRDITVLIRTNTPDAHSGYCMVGRWSTRDTANYKTYMATPDRGIQILDGTAAACPLF